MPFPVSVFYTLASSSDRLLTTSSAFWYSGPNVALNCETEDYYSPGADGRTGPRTSALGSSSGPCHCLAVTPRDDNSRNRKDKCCVRSHGFSQALCQFSRSTPIFGTCGSTEIRFPELWRWVSIEFMSFGITHVVVFDDVDCMKCN